MFKLHVYIFVLHITCILHYIYIYTAQSTERSRETEHGINTHYHYFNLLVSGFFSLSSSCVTS